MNGKQRAQVFSSKNLLFLYLRQERNGKVKFAWCVLANTLGQQPENRLLGKCDYATKFIFLF